MWPKLTKIRGCSVDSIRKHINIVGSSKAREFLDILCGMELRGYGVWRPLGRLTATVKGSVSSGYSVHGTMMPGGPNSPSLSGTGSAKFDAPASARPRLPKSSHSMRDKGRRPRALYGAEV